ncbi:MAG: NAD(P)-binding domain-containing protein [Nitrososphaerota archaeon]
MKIGILGSGDVGRRLADGFIELGHKITIGFSYCLFPRCHSCCVFN